MEDFQDLDPNITEGDVNPESRQSIGRDIADATFEIGCNVLNAMSSSTPPESVHLEPMNLEMPAEMAEAVGAIVESAGEGLMGFVEGAGEIVGAVAEGVGELVGGILGGL
jgi:hypothetical protein